MQEPEEEEWCRLLRIRVIGYKESLLDSSSYNYLRVYLRKDDFIDLLLNNGTYYNTYTELAEEMKEPLRRCGSGGIDDNNYV